MPLSLGAISRSVICFTLLYFALLEIALLLPVLYVPSHGAVVWSAVCNCGISWSYSVVLLEIVAFLGHTQLPCLKLLHFLVILSYLV